MDKPVDIEEKKVEWESFVRRAKIKTANHTTMVRFYNAVYNTLIMTVILLAGILTCLILLGGMAKPVLASLAGACTILTAISKFLIADRKKAGHKKFSKLFQTLLIRMLRCQTVAEYNALWGELHETIIKEPLLLIWSRRSRRIKIHYSMEGQLLRAFEGKNEPEPNQTSAQQGYTGIHQGYTGADQGYTATPQRYSDIQQGYFGSQHGYTGPQQRYIDNQPEYRTSMNIRSNQFNPHDFHVMSIDERRPSQQTFNGRGGYAPITDIQEHESRTTRINNKGKNKSDENIADEKAPSIQSSGKSKKKKTRTDSEKSRQQYLGSSSQGTLDEIEEEQENEEQQSVLETSDSVALTQQRKMKKKKGQNNQSKTPLPEELPPPPLMEEDEESDEYDDNESQKLQTGRPHPSPSKGSRNMTGRNDRSIVYDEQEENELSEDTDDLDENEDIQPYARN